jgi:Zinc knuckle
MWDYKAFLGELEDNFGPHDPVGDAEKSLSELVMKKTTKIMKYNVDFWELASRVSWNEAALRDHYFRGLPLCLRTEVLHGGKPQTLAELHLKAQDADNIYWMQEEARIESKNSGGSDRNSRKKDSKGSSNSNNNSNNNSNSNNQSKSQSSSNNGNSTSSGSNVGNKGSSSKDKPKNSISDNLGKNGKLIGEEWECCLKEGLCLYCGEKGHIAHNCPKSKAAKARVATVTPESKSDSADSKK